MKHGLSVWYQVGDRLRGWVYFSVFAVMVSLLWAAAWTQSVEHDLDRTWMPPAVPRTWVADEDEPAPDGLRFNAGLGGESGEDLPWRWSFGPDELATTRPASSAPSDAGSAESRQLAGATEPGTGATEPGTSATEP